MVQSVPSQSSENSLQIGCQPAPSCQLARSCEGAHVTASAEFLHTCMESCAALVTASHVAVTQLKGQVSGLPGLLAFLTDIVSVTAMSAGFCSVIMKMQPCLTCFIAVLAAQTTFAWLQDTLIEPKTVMESATEVQTSVEVEGQLWDVCQCGPLCKPLGQSEASFSALSCLVCG